MTISQDTLANGMQIVSDRMVSVETVTLGVWVATGSRNEPAEINGVSHLLEHMAFKGTKRRSALEIAVEMENVGGHLNAYTSRDATVYYATVLKENVNLALDIIADILLHSEFNEDELERERAVVLQEIGQANDTPDDIIFDRFQETAYPDQALGRPILGTTAIVGQMPRDILLAYMKAQYGAGRMILSAAGNLDHDDLVRCAERVFKNVPQHSAGSVPVGCYTGGKYCENRDLEQVHLVFGFEGVGLTDDDYFSQSVYSTAMGGGMSSRLFQEVREKRGLVYSLYTFNTAYQDGGLFGIYAGTSAEKVPELINAVADECLGAANALLDDQEITRARTQIKAEVLMSLESTSSRAERLARQLQVHGRIVPLGEISARIDGVSLEDVRRVAAGLVASPLTLAHLGPVVGAGEYDKVIQRLGG